MINVVCMEGLLLEPVVIRVMPSGLLVGRMEIQHESRFEATPPLEEWLVKLTVVAIGPLAEQTRYLIPGAMLVVEGRLNQKRWLREGETRWGKIELIAQRIELSIQKAQTPQSMT